jgi:hypothetical protein
MKTRVWKVSMTLHDLPGFDENGEPESYLRQVDIERELLSIGPQCYGLSVSSMDIKLVGHIAAAPSSRKARGDGKAKNGGAV